MPSPDLGPLPAARVLGVRVDVGGYPDFVDRIFAEAAGRRPFYVCVANVHTVLQARHDPSFARVVEDAPLVTPDGMPLVWEQKHQGHAAATRVYGPALTLAVCERAAREGVPVGFYGGTPWSCAHLVERLRERYPALPVAYAYSPPFRPLTSGEEREVVDGIRASGAAILFVGLGSPKQEYWIADHWRQLPLVSLGVGAAFDFLSGAKPQAPGWMQGAGMEWAFRLLTEPRRLAGRYLRDVPEFLAATLREHLRPTLGTTRQVPLEPARR